MKRLLTAVAVLLASAAVHAQEPGTVVATQRDANQQERIEQGLQSGQLNAREAGQLERVEQHIDRQQAHDLKSGAALTPQEKAKIQHEQNQVSRDIYRDQHNGVTGTPNSASSQRLQSDVQRNAKQQQRIANGVKSGQLTNREAGHLEARQKRVDRHEANAAANGHVGAAEQARVQGSENRQSERVHDKKHNDRTRGGN